MSHSYRKVTDQEENETIFVGLAQDVDRMIKLDCR